jgi:hypothetical protein
MSLKSDHVCCSSEHSGERTDSKVRGLIIGQAPPGPPESLPSDYLPLQGQPERRLARLAGLASPDHLWQEFDRIDLIGWCPGPKDRKSYHITSTGYRKHCCDGHRFPLSVARLAASRLITFGGLSSYAMVVLCGRHVASAFGLRLHSRGVPWAEELNGVRFLVLPHPSGVSHFWNDEVSWHRAAGTFRAALNRLGFFEQGHLQSVCNLPIESDRKQTISQEQTSSTLKQKRNTDQGRSKTHLIGAVKKRPARNKSLKGKTRVVRSRFFKCLQS